MILLFLISVYYFYSYDITQCSVANYRLVCQCTVILVNYFCYCNIRSRTMEIWTQAYLDASRQTQLKVSLNDLPFLYYPQWCSGYDTWNLGWWTRFKSLHWNKYLYTGFDYLIFCLYNLHNFSPNIINKLTKWEGDF